MEAVNNTLEIKRRKLVVEKCKELLSLIDNDRFTHEIYRIIEYNNTQINFIQKGNHLISSPSNKEIGTAIGTIKRFLYFYYNGKNNLPIEIKIDCFSKELIENLILKSRYYNDFAGERAALCYQIKKSLENQILSEYLKQLL